MLRNRRRDHHSSRRLTEAVRVEDRRVAHLRAGPFSTSARRRNSPTDATTASRSYRSRRSVPSSTAPDDAAPRPTGARTGPRSWPVPLWTPPTRNRPKPRVYAGQEPESGGGGGNRSASVSVEGTLGRVICGFAPASRALLGDLEALR